MKSKLLIICLLICCFKSNSQSTIIKYLSGTDKSHTVQWDFYCTGGMNSNKWTKIAVPSNWELQGFGSYNYGHDKVKANEQGLYKYSFYAQPGWQGKKVFIVFEGSMTDTKVMINGKSAGAVHQGGFYRFKYDITDLLKFNAQNLLEVTVSKTSADASVNKAERNGDFWLYGGIYRPVYLEVVPETFIDRIAINAKADGSFQLDAYPQNT
jgi:beta-galactosidase/beta-glucuronidase